MASSNIRPLTKKDLSEALGVQTRNFDKKLNDQTKEFKSYTDQQTESLATIVNTAFQDQKDHFDQRFDDIEEPLGVVDTKLDRALYTELTHLEARVSRLEERIQPTQAKVQNV